MFAWTRNIILLFSCTLCLPPAPLFLSRSGSKMAKVSIFPHSSRITINTYGRRWRIGGGKKSSDSWFELSPAVALRCSINLFRVFLYFPNPFCFSVSRFTTRSNGKYSFFLLCCVVCIKLDGCGYSTYCMQKRRTEPSKVAHNSNKKKYYGLQWMYKVLLVCLEIAEQLKNATTKKRISVCYFRFGRIASVENI